MTTRPERLDALVAWYATLTPESLPRLAEFYNEDVHFRDPFHDFRSRARLRRIYALMFERLQEPRFFIRHTVAEGNEAVLIWDMVFGLRGQQWRIHGSSHLVFSEDGRVRLHRDYWDAAGELYEKLPLLGWLIRRVKRQLQKQE